MIEIKYIVNQFIILLFNFIRLSSEIFFSASITLGRLIYASLLKYAFRCSFEMFNMDQQ
jgi:hypothetical protein